MIHLFKIEGLIRNERSLDGNGPLDQAAVFASSIIANTTADLSALPLSHLGRTVSIFSAGFALVQGDNEGAGNVIRAGFLSPIESDIVTLKNGGISGIAASGVNSSTASINSIVLGVSRAFGSSNQSYKGRYSIGHGNEALVWIRRNQTGNPAAVVGNSIVLKKGYFNLDNFPITGDNLKRQLFLHEAVHVRQQRRLGTGGQLISILFRSIQDPNILPCRGRTDCGLIEQAIERYTDGTGNSLNPLEVEAEIEEILFRDSRFYWSNIPIFR